MRLHNASSKLRLLQTNLVNYTRESVNRSQAAAISRRRLSRADPGLLIDCRLVLRQSRL